LLTSLCFKLSSIRGILLNLIDDHVKHVFEHVKVCSELPCLRAITSNIAGSFRAQARSCCARSRT
jgi:hypothetical protein